MELIVQSEPCLVLEAAELLFAYVNNIPVQKTAGAGPFCISPWQLQQFMNTNCESLDPNDDALQFLFRAEPLRDSAENSTCIARNLLYASLDLSRRTSEDLFDWLSEQWHRLLSGSAYPVGIGKYTLNWDERTKKTNVPLDHDINRLGVSKEYQSRLLTAFADIDGSLARLRKLLEPIEQALDGFLAPWIENTGGLTQSLETFFLGPDLEERLQMLWGLSPGTRVDTIHIALRYLDAGGQPGQFIMGDRTVSYWHYGVGDRLRQPEQNTFQEWELRVMRLMGNATRMQMLQELNRCPMSARELAAALHLNLGSVSRDLNSLFDARLIMVEMHTGRRLFVANKAAISEIAQHLEKLF